LNLSLSDLIALKMERDNNSVFGAGSLYGKDFGRQRYSVKGTPNLGEIRGVFIAIENTKASSAVDAEVWVNELRLSELDERGAWAALGRMDLILADLGSVSVSVNKRTAGFGTIEQKMNERSKTGLTQFDIATNIDAGKLLPKQVKIALPVFAGINRTTENPMFDPKICFVSSRRDSETVKKAVAMGASDYIVKPVLSGTLLAKVNTLLGGKDQGEKFSSASCSFQAVLAGSDAVQPDLLITQVSETGVIIRSSAHLQEGALVHLILDELQQIIELESEHLIFRIGKCEKMSWGKYQIEASFVGLPEEKVVKLRSFTIKGNFLGDSSVRKPA
jgi:DNA-binding NarL/FixJ family response regulator